VPGPLFEEDFNTCEISGHWLVSIQDDTLDGSGFGAVDIFQVGAGDCAVSMHGPPAPSLSSSDHTTNIHSFLNFDRGEDLRVTFRFWGDPANEMPWGSAYPGNSQIGGPFHVDQFNLLFRQEAIIRYWDLTNDRMHFAQPGEPWVPTEREETWMSTAFHDAFEAALSKAESVLVRVWLGDTEGAAVEYSTDDGVTWLPEHDFRGQPAFAAGKHSTTVFLGWGSYSGALVIDDIVVAIIAILATIAVPNFLQAQTRSKVTRTIVDMRTVGIAINSYVVDWSRTPRPNDGRVNATGVIMIYNMRPTDPAASSTWMGRMLTTPVPYITSIPVDHWNTTMVRLPDNTRWGKKVEMSVLASYIPSGDISGTGQISWKEWWETQFIAAQGYTYPPGNFISPDTAPAPT